MKRTKMRPTVLIFATMMCISMWSNTALAVEAEVTAETEMVEETIESTSISDELSYTDENAVSEYNDLAVISENDVEIVDFGKCGDNLTWILYENGNLIISGTGGMYDYSISLFQYLDSPWSSYNSSICSVIIKDGVTRIGNYAFYNCGALNITIPNSVTSIGYCAFKNCMSLTSIVIPELLIVIPEYAFEWCVSLTSISIPENMWTIGKGAFTYCLNLKDVYYGGSVEEWENIEGRSYDGSYYDYLFHADIHYFEYDHAFDEWAITKVATATETGIRERTCTVCGYTEWETTPIDANITAAGTCGENIDWVLTIDGTLTVSGTGAMYDYRTDEHQAPPWTSYNSSICSVIIKDGVTSIGNYAFSNSNISNVTIPDTVTSICFGAFESCYYLSSIVIPRSVQYIFAYTFRYCYSLASITIPESVVGIGKEAFYYCNSLKDVYYAGSGVAWEMIEDRDYYDGCGNDYLFNANIHYNWEESDSCIEHTFGEWVVTKEATSTEIGIQERTCEVCGETESEEIPIIVNIIDSGTCGDNLTWVLDCEGTLTISGTGEMYDYSYPRTVSPWYYYQNNIHTVVITDGVTDIGDDAFYGCSILSGVEIPDSVTSIGHRSFYGCLSLTNIEIPNSVITIGAYAFYGCTSLINVQIPNSVTVIYVYAFEYCTSLTNVEIPDSVTTIGDYAFRGCSSLTSVKIPDSVTSINSAVFSECSNLTSVEIPDSVTTIGSYAFCLCNSLLSVEIPSSVARIEQSAFYGCSSLSDVYYDGSKTEWNLIDIEFSNDILTSATIHYNGNDNISCTEHTPDEAVIENEIPATCTAIGSYEEVVRCTVCGEKISRTVIETEQLAHTFGEWVVVTDVVEMEMGILEHTCVVCGYKENNIIDSGMCGDNVTWVLVNDGNLIISGTGEMWSYSYWSSAPWYFYQDSIRFVTITDGVTSIGNYAFYNCSSLTSVVIPDSVTSIGDSAFSDCGNLSSVDIPDSVTSIDENAFYNCSSLTSVVISDLVTSIGSNAFYNCSSLTSVVIPDSVTSIGGYAFYNCSSLTSVVIPDSVTSIGSYAFADCAKLTDVTLSDYMYSIEEGTFSGCSSLTRITFPELLKSIGDYAFSDCSKLTSITFPDTLTSIGNYAFQNCVSLTDIIIPDHVKRIGNYAFYSCSSLDTIICTGLLDSIGNYAFAYSINLTSVTLPNTLTSIGEYAFYNCVRLTEIVIPDHVNYIGYGAFMNCKRLTSAILPNDLTSINYRIFYDCSSLSSVTISSSVTYIDSYAFYDCIRMKDIYYSGFEVEWNAIEINYEGNEYLAYATKHYAVSSEPLEIMTQPEDITTSVGENITITVLATGDGLTYQWQYKRVGGDWTSWKNYKSASMTAKATAAWDGMKIRCVITDSNGNTVTTREVQSSFKINAITITSEPQDITTVVGENVTMSVEATGDGLAYQWQYKRVGGDWTSWKNYKSASMSAKATSAWDGMKIRCIITDTNGNTVTTREVQSSFKSSESVGITITSEPQDITTAVGESVTLSVVSTGDGLTYQWQYKRVNGNWTSWSSYKSASMTTKATAAWNGMKIRCIITDSKGNTVTTREVQSSFQSSESVGITITSEPQDITTAVGENVTLSVAATGKGLTYQWQYKRVGGDWTSWKNYKSASMTTKATAAWDGMKIRCIITDVNGYTATTREIQCSFASIKSENVIIESKNATISEEIEAVEIPQEEEETKDIGSDTTEEVVETPQEDIAIEETVETIE